MKRSDFLTLTKLSNNYVIEPRTLTIEPQALFDLSEIKRDTVLVSNIDTREEGIQNSSCTHSLFQATHKAP